MSQASMNTKDGISFVKSAEGALNEVHDILHRANELAVKAANDTNQPEDRKAIYEVQCSQIMLNYHLPYLPVPSLIPVTNL